MAPVETIPTLVIATKGGKVPFVINQFASMFFSELNGWKISNQTLWNILWKKNVYLEFKIRDTICGDHPYISLY